MSEKQKTYSEKLRDPRWQRKRLEVMQRDNFQCVLCGTGDETLHVHHGYYEKGNDPWDYDDCSLWTLCKECHEAVASKLDRIKTSLGETHPLRLDAVLAILLLLSDPSMNPEILRVHMDFDGTLRCLVDERQNERKGTVDGKK